jgi:hypothetical protein
MITCLGVGASDQWTGSLRGPRRLTSAAQASGELEGADGLAGVPAREQPGGHALVAEGGVTAAGCGQLQGQGVEGLGEDEGSRPSRMRTWPSAA